MTDPAAEAVWRAWVSEGDMYSDGTIAAAREMAAPIRELHYRVPKAIIVGFLEYEDGCKECVKPWPCPTALLVYTTEELCSG